MKNKQKNVFNKEDGMSLVEVMIAVTILGIVVLGVMRAYYYVSKGLLVTSAGSTSNILARDKIEGMKGIAFARLVATPELAAPSFGGSLDHSSNPYPPETFTISNRDYKRFTAVYKMRENASGELEELHPNSASEGIKKIKVRIEWTDASGSSKSVSLENLVQDPNRTILNGQIVGRIKYNPGSPQVLVGASVYIVQNLNWTDVSDSDGDYSIYVTTGSYDVTVTMRGYVIMTKNVNVTVANSPVDLDFILTELATGSISGDVNILVSTGPVAKGATVTCDDGNSSPSIVLAGGNYLLTDVATGYWTVVASSISIGWMGSTTSVHVTDGGLTSNTDVILDSPTTNGCIAGQITCGGLPVSGIQVSAGIESAYTNIMGVYLIANVFATTYTIVANPEPANSSYTTEISPSVYVGPGVTVFSEDIVLIEAGSIIGTVVIGIAEDPLPGIIIKAVDIDTVERAATISASDGTFAFERIPAGGSYNPYTISPVLNPDDSSDPMYRLVDVTQGVTEDEDTSNDDIEFLIAPSIGNIFGVVTDGGAAITTGILIIASTSTISSPPPTINNAFRSGNNIYYGTVSDVEGAYSVAVYTNLTYNLAAWYTSVDGSGVSTSRISKSGIVVVSTDTVVNFEW